MSIDEFSTFVEGLSDPPDNAQELAKALIRSGKLTRYQATAVYQGKTRLLSIGEYIVIDKLGTGGMGVVFKARHRKMDRIVALKVMTPGSMKDRAMVDRFYREVRTAASLSHANIVTAHDAGEQEGVHYLVMEFVDGEDLDDIIRSRVSFSPRRELGCGAVLKSI